MSKTLPKHRPGSRVHDRASLAAHRIGEGPGISRPAPKDFDAKHVLKQTGFRLADEGRSARGDARVAAGLAGKIGGGDFVGNAGNLALLVLGSILALILLDLLIGKRGSSITSAGVKWAGGLVGRLVDPTDPLTTPGTGASPTQTATGTAAAAVSSGHSAAGSTGWSQYGGPLYPTPSGRLSPVVGASRSGIELDSSYVLFAQWIEKHFGVTVTSGYRTPAENAAAGGKSNSDHLKGLAADFGGTPAALNRLYAWASKVNFPYLESPVQAAAAGEGPHVHITFYRPHS